MYVIYSKDNCPQCTQAISACKQMGLDHEVLKLGKDFDLESLTTKVEATGAPAPRSFPQVFQDDAYIGDFTKFREHLVSL